MANILQAAGGAKALASALGIHRTAVLRWTRVPARRVRDVALFTGIPAHSLRPDLAAIFSASDAPEPAPTTPGNATHEHASEERQ